MQLNICGQATTATASARQQGREPQISQGVDFKLCRNIRHPSRLWACWLSYRLQNVFEHLAKARANLAHRSNMETDKADPRL